MIELTIKTLDAQNHHFTVPNDYTVEQLKEHIADTIQIPSESQRCIYLGQVLQNDTKLSDCDVNGKVIHVVQRPPPSSAYSNANDNPTPNSGPVPGRRPETHTGTMYLSAMAFPADFVDAGGLTFLHQLHPRTNLPLSRLAVARNLLRRTTSIINQLESENYFNSSSEQNNQFSGFATNNLSDDITGADAGGGLDQPEVEIRVESPNLHDNASENVGSNVNNDLPESAGLNGASSNPDNVDDSQNADTSSNNQNDDSASGTSNRDDLNRRRPSRTPIMATVMGAVLHAQIRLIPFMRLLRQYLIQDTTFGPDSQTTHTEQQIQSLYNSVSELMHYFSHIYHSLSDIMCDFSQPPPRTLRCRPVILQQQHATVLRSGPRARPLIRSPLVAVARSAPSTNSTASSDASANSTNPANTAANATSTGGESNGTENNVLNRGVGVPSVEVVIEEADTTNMQDNVDDGTAENMDLGEPTEGSANGAASGGAPTVTMHARGGNTFVIQSMPSLPDGVLPDGIRINSVEATILAPNDDLAAAFTGGSNNQRWRAGVLPAEVLQNMFGFINQVRSTQRQQQQQQQQQQQPQQQQQQQQRATNGERQRQPNAENGTNAGQSTNNANENNQSPNGPQETLEFDITGVSRTFDPFLPCHSHHIHPVMRSTNSRSTTQNTGTQASANQSGQSTQTQSGATQTAASDDQNLPQQQQQRSAESESATNDTAEQQSANRNEADGISIPEVTRNVASFINNIFPGLNIGNMMFRRTAREPANPPSEGTDRNAQGRQSARARIEVTSNLSNINTMFPGAIQIEIEPLAHDVQANVVPNNANQSIENRLRFRRARTIRRQRVDGTPAEPRASSPVLILSEPSVIRTSRLRLAEPRGMRLAPPGPRPANMDFRGRPHENQSSLSPSSSASLSSLSSDEDVADTSGREKKKPKKEENHGCSPSKAIKNFYTMVQKESVRSHLLRKKPATNYPLYQDNQEALFFEIVNSAIKNISLEQLTRGCEATVEQVASSVCRNIRNYLSTQPNAVSSIKEDLLSVVNVLVNNDLYKMKNLLDSDCVKQEIDLVSTICKFNQDSIPELIECIINCEDLTEIEIKKFYQIFKFYVARLLTLFVHCVAGNDKSINIRKVLGSVIEEILKGLPKNEELARWLRKDLINHVISYSKICHPDTLPAFMKHYVVYRLPPVVPVKCTVATALTSVGNNNNATTSQSQPMEVEEAAQLSSSNSSETSFVSANSEENRAAGESANAQVCSNPPNNSSTSTETVPEVTLNSEEWHRSFPSDWVPIIARDIHRLRRQGSQPPYSDAYLSGMPTKRRKLIKNSKPNVNSNEQLINGNITTAIDSAGLSASLNSVSNQMSSENSVNSNAESLSNMAKEELKENVRENIVQQTDFLPSRFPDSAKYFMDK